MSWQEIILLYRHFGEELQQYEGIRQRFGAKLFEANVHNSSEHNVFIFKFWRDIKDINAKLRVLDAEIARRNNLIGVIG